MKRNIFAVISLIVIIAGVAGAEGPVVFGDPNLKAAVEETLKVTNPSPTAMLGLTAMTAQAKGIGDISGLEYATNLTSLSLYDNKVEDVSPLSKLTGLTHLNLWKNQISDAAPLANLTGLTELWLAENPVTDISVVAKMPDLDRLFLFRNGITDISAVAGLKNLTGLSLHHNKISDISAVAGLTSLDFLWLGGNEITDISPVAGLTDLPQLSVYDNQISDISSVAGLTKLTYLEMHDNQISDVSAISAMTELTLLLISGNQIADVSPLSGMKKLRTLKLYDNRITDVSPVTKLPGLRILSLKGNPVQKPGDLGTVSTRLKLELDATTYTQMVQTDDVGVGKVKIPEQIEELTLLRDRLTIVIANDDKEVTLPVGRYQMSGCRTRPKEQNDDKWQLRCSGFSKSTFLDIRADGVDDLKIAKPITANLKVTGSRSGYYTISQNMTGPMGEKIEIFKNGARAEAPSVRIFNSDSTYDKTFKFKYG
jgi:Leucine-rich repeat (LRR) protein